MRVVKALDAGADASRRPAADRRRTRRAKRSSATSPSSAPPCSCDVLRRAGDGPAREEAAGRAPARPTRPGSTQGRRAHRLGARRRAPSTTRSAACTRGRTPSRRSTARRVIVLRTAPGGRRRRPPAAGAGHDRSRRAGDRLARRHRRGAPRTSLRSSPRATRAGRRASSSPAARLPPGAVRAMSRDRAGARAPRTTRSAAVDAGRSRSARRARRARADASPTSAIARWPPKSPPARCAGRARSTTSSAPRRPARSPARSRGARHPPAQRLSAAPPRPRARRRPSWTTRSSWRRRRGKTAPPGSSTRCCAASRAARRAAAARRARPRRPTTAGALDYLSSRCRTRAGSPSAGSTRTASTARSRGCEFDNAAGAADAAGQHAAERRATSWPRASRAHGVDGEPTRFAPDGLVVVDGQSAAHAAGLDEGLFVLAGRGLAARARCSPAPRPGERVLDACAAPGGKTTALAAAMRRPRARRRGRRPAAGASAPAARPCRGPARRACASCRPTPRRRCPSAPVFDAVLRGRAVLGARHAPARPRHPVAAAPRRTCPQFARRAARDARARRRGRAPGGRLVYATCSSEPEENEEVVEAFLRTPPGVRARSTSADRAGGPLPGAADA